MPWRGPEVPGEYPTLGFQVVALIESRCVVPDGPRAGEPFVCTNEQFDWLMQFYRLRPDAEPGQDESPFVHFRGGQLIRPQKWGKAPITAGQIVAEAHPEGPVLFDGWDASGEPVGSPWPTPHVQVTAWSQDQTDNIWRALKPMIDNSPVLSSEIPDTGLDRINIPGGGIIETVTSSAQSRLGARVTFVPQDESGTWTRENGMRRVADVQRRGLAGMDGRFAEFTNGWDPAEKSVAQETNEGSRIGVLVDDVEPGAGDIRNKEDRHRMIREVYGDSLWTPENPMGWVRLSRIDAEIVELMERDPAQAERFFLNRKRAQTGAVFDVDGQFLHLAQSGYRPPGGSLVAVAVDGARFQDAIAIVGLEIATGFLFTLGVWTRPERAERGYEHPADEINGVMDEAFDEFDVWRVYVDPQHIDHLFDPWQGKWGKERVLPWWTNRPKQMAWAVRNYENAIAAASARQKRIADRKATESDLGGRFLAHDGDHQLVQHHRNAIRWPVRVKDDKGQLMHVIGKEAQDSHLKVDLSVASVVVWECGSDAIAAGATKTKTPSRVPRSLR